MAFSADERLLCSAGAGGALYFWDLATGARLSEAEYVDKRCVFTSVALAGALAGGGGGPAAGRAAAGGGAPSAVVRGADGRLQHVREGRVVFEAAGPSGRQPGCMHLLGGGRVLLTTDAHGEIRCNHF
jgi:hypothetical protein